MNEFKTYHPLVNFIFYLEVIGFSMFFMHPICLAISLLGGFWYSVMLKGRSAIKNNLIYMIPVMMATALINPMFNHDGVTIICYLPSQNPLTAESIAYGFGAAVMLCSVICWFSSYNEVMTSDKFIYLFGRIIPSMSLIISMTLRFVPRFLRELKSVMNAQKCMGRDMSKGSVLRRAKNGLAVLSIMLTRSLENSVETADSMRARGYGLPQRTSFSIYTFDKRDRKALICILILGIYILVGKCFGEMGFSYFPIMKGTDFSLYGVSVFVSYLMLCMCPIIIEAVEEKRWKALKSKI